MGFGSRAFFTKPDLYVRKTAKLTLNGMAFLTSPRSLKQCVTLFLAVPYGSLLDMPQKPVIACSTGLWSTIL